MIEYWKRKYIPEKCPTCGAGSPEPRGEISLSEMFRVVFSGWQARLLRHPRWGIPCWFGHCVDCAVVEQLKQRPFWADVIKPSGRFSKPVVLTIGDAGAADTSASDGAPTKVGAE